VALADLIGRVVSRRATLLAALLVAAVTVIAAADRGSAQGTGGGGPTPPPPAPNNPCLTEAAKRLLCPDLRIAAPSELYIDTAIRPGKRLLRATNNIRSRGLGPAELRGIKIAPGTMRANQGIYKRGGGRLVIRTQARLDFYPIPGQYRYWKMRDAAAFEMWAVNNEGRPTERVRVGPKLHYCLRDLTHTRPGMPRSPAGPVYPACSQVPSRRRVVLGTSVGWSDIYPATYHQNWINVTGLSGCFAFFHVVDPRNHIRESNERNNRSHVLVRLPSGRRVTNC
jgi:hypothetical protein